MFSDTTADFTSLKPDVAPLRVTVVCHPDLRRIGEQVDLDLAAAKTGIARMFPEFGPPGWPADRPIGVRCVSRQPVRFELEPDAVTVLPNATTHLSGEYLEHPATLDAAVLRQGVLVALGRWVLLHVRRLPPSVPRLAPLFGISPEALLLQKQLEDLAQTRGPVLFVGSLDRERAIEVLAGHAGMEAPLDVTLAGIPSGPALREELFGSAARAGLVGDGRRLVWIRDVDSATDEMIPVLQQFLAGRKHPIGELPSDVHCRALASVESLEEVPDGLRDRFSDVVTLPDELALEDVAWHLGRTLVERLEQVDRAHVIERNPGWAEAESIRRLLTGPWRGDSHAVAHLARQIVLASPDTHLEVPEPDEPKPAEGDDDEKVLATLDAHGYRISVAAKALGMSPNTLRRRMAELGVPTASSLTDAQIAAAAAAHHDDVARMARALRVSAQGLRLRMARGG